jgi:hypothetical protein
VTPASQGERGETLALGLVAGAAAAGAVALQVVLPRVLSVVLWYHLGFFCVTLAMLGAAAGAVLVARRTANAGGTLPDPQRLAWLAAAAAALAPALALRLPIDPRELIGDPLEAGMLLALAAILGAPFVLLGATTAAALARAGDRLGAVYAASFLGGAAGAVLGYVAMNELGAPRALVIAATLPLLALARPREPVPYGPLLFVLVLLGALLARPAELLPMRSTKHFPVVADEQVLAERWNAFSRVTFYENPARHGLWEMPPGAIEPLPESIGIAIDSWAITSILKVDSKADLGFLRRYPPALAYCGAAAGFDALVIGAGGGADVHSALHFGAGHVDAVEINPLITEAVREDFREFAGDLYRRPEVDAHVAEGRHFVERSAGRYDRIVLNGVDTFAATEAGAFALSENYLYTREALAAYLSRLAPGGIVAFTRWWYEPERQTLRLAATAAEALERRGVADPAAHVFIARTPLNALLLVGERPFETAEVDALLAELPGRGLVQVFAPGRPGNHPAFVRALDATMRDALVAEWPYRIEPTTDDRPFFFEYTRLDRLFRSEGDWIHDRLGGIELIVATLVGLLLLALPLLYLAPRGAASRGLSAECLLLGLAFAVVEAALLPRLALVLGHPSRALTVVLVAVLVFAGIGSLAAHRLDPRRASRAALAAGVMVAVILAFSHDELAAALLGASDAERILATLLFLALPGFCMGIPLALRLRSESGTGIARGLAWNGVGAALGGPLAALLALTLGFQATLFAGAAAYAAAALAGRTTPPSR